MPENTVCVDRSSKWGNPFRLIGDQIYSDASHRRSVLEKWVIFDSENLYSKIEGQKKCCELYLQWICGYLSNIDIKPCPFTFDEMVKKLKGKNLACYCKLGDPCHADVLIKLLKTHY